MVTLCELVTLYYRSGKKQDLYVTTLKAGKRTVALTISFRMLEIKLSAYFVISGKYVLLFPDVTRG